MTLKSAIESLKRVVLFRTCLTMCSRESGEAAACVIVALLVARSTVGARTPGAP